MTDNKADIETDIREVVDRKERPSLMEAFRLSETSRHRGALTDLAMELASQSALITVTPALAAVLFPTSPRRSVPRVISLTRFPHTQPL